MFDWVQARRIVLQAIGGKEGGKKKKKDKTNAM